MLLFLLVSSCVVNAHLCGEPCKLSGRLGCLEDCTKVTHRNVSRFTGTHVLLVLWACWRRTFVLVTPTYVWWSMVLRPSFVFLLTHDITSRVPSKGWIDLVGNHIPARRGVVFPSTIDWNNHLFKSDQFDYLQRPRSWHAYLWYEVVSRYVWPL